MNTSVHKSCFFLILLLCLASGSQAQLVKWDSVVHNGFGNLNQIQVNAVKNYKNMLYGGTSSSNSTVTSADLFASASGDTSSWFPIHAIDSMISPSAVAAFTCLTSTNSGTGYLFAGTGKNANNKMYVYRKSGNVWSNFSPFHPNDTIVDYNQIDVMTTFSMNGNGDSLFMALDNYTLGAQIYASPVAAPSFNLVCQLPSSLGSISDMVVFNNKIYACTNSGRAILSSADGHNWYHNAAADTGISSSMTCCYSKMAVYNGALYVGITNNTNGCQIYMTNDGVTWNPVMTGGFGHGSNFCTINSLHAAYGNLWISSNYSMPSIAPKGNPSTLAGSMGTWIYRMNSSWVIKAIDSTGFDGYCSSSCLEDMNHFIYAGTYNPNLGAQIWRTCVAPTPSFMVPTFLCTGSSYVFSDTASGTTRYKWYVNGILKDSLHSSYTYIASTSGNVVVKLVVYNQSCSDSLTQGFSVYPAVSVNLGGNKTICYGDSIKLKGTVSGGTSPYSYSWCIGGTTDSVKVAPTSQTTYTLQVTDQFGCTSIDSARITVPAALSAGMASNQNVCTHDTLTINGSATGGTAPYTYSWNTGSHIDSIRVQILVKTTYTLTVHDALGCQSRDTLTIFVVPGPVITGTVTAPSAGVINSGKAYLIKYNALPEKQFVVDTVAIVSGRYTFNHVDGGEYFVFAKANAATYPYVVKTYYPNADDWIKATQLAAPCQTSDTANIVMLELTPPAGSATFYGMVEQGPSYGHTHRPRHQKEGRQPGDPIPGLDVNLEQHPGGIIVGHDTTDSHGNYHFSNIPPGQYDVYVDIPGLGMVSQYTRTVSGTETFTQLNYTVDSTHIYKDSILVTGISNPTVTVNSNMKITPNPFKDAFSVAYTVETAGPVNISLFNLIGQEVITPVSRKQDAGDYVISFDSTPQQVPPGVYILRMTLNGKSESRRLVRIR
ncbi:MAG: T9SS type A sorting domain-containing protein [Bacteroidia bacterium]